MGRITTPAYRVEYRDNLSGRTVQTMAWHGSRDGRANAANLEKWRRAYNRSFGPNGTNAHLARAYGLIPHIHYARLIRQSDGKLIAETTMPAFEVV